MTTLELDGPGLRDLQVTGYSRMVDDGHGDEDLVLCRLDRIRFDGAGVRRPSVWCGLDLISMPIGSGNLDMYPQNITKLDIYIIISLTCGVHMSQLRVDLMVYIQLCHPFYGIYPICPHRFSLVCGGGPVLVWFGFSYRRIMRTGWCGFGVVIRPLAAY